MQKFLRNKRPISVFLTIAMVLTILSPIRLQAAATDAYPDHLIILQTYGGGQAQSATPVSHSFIELYNPTAETIDLSNYKIAYYDDRNTERYEWETALSGELQPGASYLIRGQALTDLISPAYQIDDFDLELPDNWLDNKEYGVQLTDQHGNLINEMVYDSVDNKHTSRRRVDFAAAGDERIDYRTDKGMTEDRLEEVRPHSSAEGSWGPYNGTTSEVPLTGVELMSLTRETATEAEAGNQFGADSGVYADQSGLTAWSNNTQKVIGGTGRTPIVFNNAQTTDGWKPVSVAGVDGADAFQIEFSTSGYENIRFTCRQKSTGSGPDAFVLAYSIGSADGPYTVIDGSETGTNGIPAITRVSNNEYSALAASYTDFALPADTEDQADVYLRVVFNGSESLGANGNTSINDIIITGDQVAGSTTVVTKDALNEVIAAAAQKVESDYTAATWAPLQTAYETAVRVAADDGATQAEVNAARISLRNAMNALVRQEDAVDVIDWPGSDEIEIYDGELTFLEDSSGLDFHDGQLYAVDNGTGIFWIIDVAADGSLSYAEGFEQGKRVRFQKDADDPDANGPDAEGITVDNDGFVYIASERDNSNKTVNYNTILKVDPYEDATDLVAIQEWDLTDSLPAVSANYGIEAVEWVPAEEVTGKLYDENTGDTFDISNYPEAIADGIFFVALEADGHVYAYILNEDESFVQIADIDSRLGGAMALDYDMYEHVLWVVADNGYGNMAANITFTGTQEVNLVHVNPPAGLDTSRNYEGFAIAEADYTIDGQRAVYRLEDGITDGALAIGSIDCDYVARGDDGTTDEVIDNQEEEITNNSDTDGKNGPDNGKNSNPQTGDPISAALSIIGFLCAAAVFAGSIFKRKSL